MRVVTIRTSIEFIRARRRETVRTPAYSNQPRNWPRSESCDANRVWVMSLCLNNSKQPSGCFIRAEKYFFLSLYFFFFIRAEKYFFLSSYFFIFYFFFFIRAEKYFFLSYGKHLVQDVRGVLVHPGNGLPDWPLRPFQWYLCTYTSWLNSANRLAVTSFMPMLANPDLNQLTAYACTCKSWLNPAGSRPYPDWCPAAFRM